MYITDVLQRVAIHPNSQIEQLTPRLWKQHFADDPMQSDLMLDSTTGQNDRLRITNGDHQSDRCYVGSRHRMAASREQQLYRVVSLMHLGQ